jgi:deazaflavin-dependent oxidoreductase (nitroreductase family)
MDTTQADRLNHLAKRHTLTLTHVGRKSGKSYQVTIWFVAAGDRIFLPTANVNRQWVRNLKQTPLAQLDIGSEKFSGTARFITDPAERAPVMAGLLRKYWMYFPVLAAGQVLAALGVMKDNSGAFEVTLGEAT